MAEKKKGFDLAEALKPVSKLDTGGQSRKQLEYIDIDLIDPDPNNRKIDGIEEMIQNLHLVGLLQPLEVRPNPDNEGRYIAVSGHRRREAIRRMVADGEEDWRLVPCLVDPLEDSPAMRRLKLLSGNIVSQALTPAEMAQAAKEVEDSIYQLQEEGHEFPGKIRDYVAKTCGIAASRVGRLKVIRENLIGDLKKDWEAGELKESVAYAFARQTPEVQVATVQYMLGHSGVRRNRWHEEPVRYAAEIIRKELRPRKCSERADGRCIYTAARLQRLATSNNYSDHCRDGKCCHGCPSLGTCEHACPHLAGEVAEAQEKAKAERTKEKEKKARENEIIVAPKLRLWKRFGEARAAAGLSWEEYTKRAGVVAFRREKKVEDFEQGRKLTPSSGGLPYAGGDGVDEWRIRPLIKAANALGCSVDYLLCRTDIRTMATGTAQSKPVMDKPQWLPGEQRPKEYDSYLCKIDLGGKTMTLTGIYDPFRAKWLHPADGEPIPYPVLGWYPIPPENDEVSTLGTEKEGDDHD